jgi:hypothetical protein
MPPITIIRAIKPSSRNCVVIHVFPIDTAADSQVDVLSKELEPEPGLEIESEVELEIELEFELEAWEAGLDGVSNL